MKNLRRKLALVSVGLFVASVAAACGGGACADLAKKKADCKGDGKELCEKAVDETVKQGKEEVCKAALDNMNKSK